MKTTTDEAEVNAILSMLVGESSDSACTKSASVAAGHVLGKDEGTHSPGSVRRNSQTIVSNEPSSHVCRGEEKKEKTSAVIRLGTRC